MHRDTQTQKHASSAGGAKNGRWPLLEAPPTAVMPAVVEGMADDDVDNVFRRSCLRTFSPEYEHMRKRPSPPLLTTHLCFNNAYLVPYYYALAMGRFFLSRRQPRSRQRLLWVSRYRSSRKTTSNSRYSTCLGSLGIARCGNTISGEWLTSYTLRTYTKLYSYGAGPLTRNAAKILTLRRVFFGQKHKKTYSRTSRIHGPYISDCGRAAPINDMYVPFYRCVDARFYHVPLGWTLRTALHYSVYCCSVLL